MVHTWNPHTGEADPAKSILVYTVRPSLKIKMKKNRTDRAGVLSVEELDICVQESMEPIDVCVASASVSWLSVSVSFRKYRVGLSAAAVVFRCGIVVWPLKQLYCSHLYIQSRRYPCVC